jgi:hypothetical protein
VTFHDGKLYLFGPDNLVVLRGGETPATWAKVCEADGRAGWFSSLNMADHVLREALRYRDWSRHTLPNALLGEYPVMPDGQMMLPFCRTLFADDLVTGRFLATLPQRYQALLQGLHEGHWRMYRFLARCGPAAVELAQSNLPLAFALAHADRLNPVTKPLRAARTLLTGRRRCTAGWLGFPASDAACAVLAKLTPDALSAQFLLYLRYTLNGGDDRQLQLLQHVPRITLPVADCLQGFGSNVTPVLLRELALGRDSRPILMRISRLNAMLLELERPLPILRSAAHVLRLFTETRREWQGHSLRGLLPEALPPPPVSPGPDSGIEPIKTLSELISEGESQRNCCADYVVNVLKGTHYLYRVVTPVRATLSMRRTSADTWTVDQLLAAGNQPLAADTRLAILGRLNPGSAGQGTGAMPVALADVGEEPPPF